MFLLGCLWWHPSLLTNLVYFEVSVWCVIKRAESCIGAVMWFQEVCFGNGADGRVMIIGKDDVDLIVFFGHR
jgi:hypothetical protein